MPKLASASRTDPFAIFRAHGASMPSASAAAAFISKWNSSSRIASRRRLSTLYSKRCAAASWMPSRCGRKRSTVRSLSVLRIEIVYAQPRCSLAKSLNLPAGATVVDALSLVASDQDFLGVDLAGCAVGIFGRVARKDQQVLDGDLVEIYRPLFE